MHGLAASPSLSRHVRLRGSRGGWSGTARRGSVAILSSLLHTGEVGRFIDWVPAGAPLNRRLAALREECQQDIGVNRLDQVIVDPRLAGLPLVLQSSVTRHGDDDRPPT